MKKHLSVLFIFSLVLEICSAQNQDVIQLPGVGNRVIEPAFRMVDSPKIKDTIMSTPVVEYPLMAVQRATKIAIQQIEPASIKTEPKLDQLYSTYAKIGLGTEIMPLGEVYFDSKRSRKYVYGAHAKHLSSYGNLDGFAPAQFDRTSAQLYGNLNEMKFTIHSKLYYQNQGLHYYGFKLPGKSNTDSIRQNIAQRYQDAGGNFHFISHKKDSAAYQYHMGVDYNYFNSKKPLIDSLKEWRAKENSIAFQSGLKYKGNHEMYTLDLNVRYNGYIFGKEGDTANTALDSGLVRNNTLINLRPFVSTYLKNNRFKAQIGAELTFDINEKTRFRAYPLAELKYSMFNDIFIPYIGLRGGLKQITFKTIVSENEFIKSNIVLRNENRVIDLYGGIKGTMSKRISFNLGASFARIQDKAFFVTDTLSVHRNMFNIVYDSLNLVTLEGSFAYQIREKLKVDAIGKYYSYELNNFEYAWNMPLWEVSTRGHYNVYDKFLVNLDIHFEGGRKALVYEDSIISQGQAPIMKQKTLALGLIADLNIGLEYRYSKRLSAFIQCNNIASQRYQRWYNYPVQMIQVMGGITARF